MAKRIELEIHNRVTPERLKDMLANGRSHPAKMIARTYKVPVAKVLDVLHSMKEEGIVEFTKNGWRLKQGG